MQFVWLLVRGYASRKATAGDHAVGAADAELEVGPLMAMPVVRGRGTVLGTHTVGMRGHAEDVQVAVADLEHEQDVQPAQRHRAVDVEEIDREHAGGLRAQELPPAGVGVPERRRRDRVAPADPADPADRRGADAVAEFEQLALDPAVPPARGLSRAIRTTSAARTSSIGGRPGGLEYVHFLWTRRRCERGIVSGVTRRWRCSARGSRRTRAAKTARSAQSRRYSLSRNPTVPTDLAGRKHGVQFVRAWPDPAVGLGVARGHTGVSVSAAGVAGSAPSAERGDRAGESRPG